MDLPAFAHIGHATFEFYAKAAQRRVRRRHDSDADSDQDQPNIKNEPYDPVQSNNQFKLPSSGTTTLNQNGKKKDPKDKVPLVKLAEKSKERRKKEKKKTKTNQIVSSDMTRVNSEKFYNWGEFREFS